MRESFYGTWFECAGGSRIVNGQLVQDIPPTCQQLNDWIEELRADERVQNDVRHRFVLTRRNFKDFVSWAKHQFKFRNATEAQIATIQQTIFEYF